MPVAFSLAAALCWGTSDFSGGYASKRSDAFLVTLVSMPAVSCSCSLLLFDPYGFSFVLQPQLGLFAGAWEGPAASRFFIEARSQETWASPRRFPRYSAQLSGCLHHDHAGTTGKLAGSRISAGWDLGVWLISRPDGSGGEPGRPLNRRHGWNRICRILHLHRPYRRQLPICRRRCIHTSPRSRWSGLSLCFERGKGPAFACGRNSRPLRRVPGRHRHRTVHSRQQTGRLDTVVVLTSLYPVFTVLLARSSCDEQFTRWKMIGIFAALLAVPLIAM